MALLRCCNTISPTWQACALLPCQMHHPFSNTLQGTQQATSTLHSHLRMTFRGDLGMHSTRRGACAGGAAALDIGGCAVPAGVCKCPWRAAQHPG